MNPKQLKLIHIAKRDVDLNDEQYRTLLRNVAHVESSKDLTNTQFEDVMATLEDLGFSYERANHRSRATFTGSGGSCARVESTYWRDKVAARGRGTGERVLWKINTLAAGLPIDLPGFCWNMTGRTDDVKQLTGQEAYKLVEALKSMHDRQERKAAPKAQGVLFV
jgi:phage gp16-like protein